MLIVGRKIIFFKNGITALHENTKLGRVFRRLCGRATDLFVYISLSLFYLSFLIQHISHALAIYYSGVLFSFYCQVNLSCGTALLKNEMGQKFILGGGGRFVQKIKRKQMLMVFRYRQGSSLIICFLCMDLYCM